MLMKLKIRWILKMKERKEIQKERAMSAKTRKRHAMNPGKKGFEMQRKKSK